MKRHLRALLCSMLITPFAAVAAEPGFDPLAFLAGHCWKGTMQGNVTDEHCFAWVYDGKFLRDRHVVRDEAGKSVYEGETIYYWNSSTMQLEYFYYTRNGGHAQGRAIPEGGAIVFPSATMVTGGKMYPFRGRWKRVGPNAYEVLREYETQKGWVPVTVVMKKVE